MALRAYFDPKQKRAIEESLAAEPSTEQQRLSRQSSLSNLPPSRRLTRMNSVQQPSKRDSLFRVAGRYYVPHIQHLSTVNRHRNFGSLLQSSGDQAPRFTVNGDELRRFSLVQVRMNQLNILDNNLLISIGSSC